MQALLLSHPRKMTRDTATYPPLMMSIGKGQKAKPRALRHLAETELGLSIQAGEHSPIDDARSALYLYHKHRKVCFGCKSYLSLMPPIGHICYQSFEVHRLFCSVLAMPCKLVTALALITVETRAKDKCDCSWNAHRSLSNWGYCVPALPHLISNALQSGENASAQLGWLRTVTKCLVLNPSR